MVISSRNFLRSLGGACGLAIASALYSNTLVMHLPSPPLVPQEVSNKIKASIFSVPDLSGLTETQKNMILDTYTLASRSVFYFWVGCISCCFLLMIFIKDKGLQRKEEKDEGEAKQRAEGPIRDDEGDITPTSGDEESLPSEPLKATSSDIEKGAAEGGTSKTKSYV